jgi:hypothetical protein
MPVHPFPEALELFGRFGSLVRPETRVELRQFWDDGGSL